MPTNLARLVPMERKQPLRCLGARHRLEQPDHYFLELTNVTTGQVWAWNDLLGSSNSKTKFGLNAGDYSWRIRGAYGANGTILGNNLLTTC